MTRKSLIGGEWVDGSMRRASARVFIATVMAVCTVVVASCSDGGSKSAAEGQDGATVSTAGSTARSTRVDARCDDAEDPAGSEPIEIFMYVPPLSESDTDALRAQLDGDEERVKCYRFVSKQDAYEDFKRMHRDDPALIARTTPEQLPESFRVVPVRREQTEEIVGTYEKAPGVREVDAQPTPEELLAECDLWADGAELVIFISVRAQPASVDTLRNRLESDTESIKSVRFLSHQDAYEEFKEIFRDQPTVIETTRPEELPESFRVVPVRSELTPQIVQKYETAPGVEQVSTNPAQCRNPAAGS